ncbi:hypothetical protein BDY19DRAFT_993033 [Irpex rosettiformis]|uniref:Uncharacterized protein n=1 Tax=Irpex rosettiformis TaxID=378272 RepID=A0ACB8U5F6_9APHY|nr:hypothetical protein BDY19DRAFT_993033 [Irpex rosettiformis]
MSARQPFIPQLKQPVSAGDSSSDSLKADTSINSDSGESNRSSATSMTLHSGASDDISLSSGINKPLNLANLGKKKKPDNEETPPFLPKARRSFDSDDVVRPFSPSAKAFKPSVNHRGLKVAAPSPFFPSTASFQPMSAFRTPRVTSPTKRHSAASIDDLNINKPHTTAEGEMFAPSDDIQQYEDVSHDGPRRLSRSSTRGLEDQTEISNGNRLRNGMDIEHEGFNYSDSTSVFEDRYTRMPARRVQKRIERTEELDVEEDYNTSKRYKLDDEQELQNNFASRRESLAPYQSSPQRSPSPSAAPRSGFVYAPLGTHAPVPVGNIRKEQPLSQVLGQDVDLLVNTHLDAYEDAKKKWSNCSIDEWRAGADELAGRFGKLLEFVKDHMNDKLALYANLETKLGSHRKVLAEREKTLEEVRDNLIRNGGNVCGIAKGLEKSGSDAQDNVSANDNRGAD